MLFKLILAFTILTTLIATNFTLTPATTIINAISDYTWNINFSPIASRNSITLSFPINVTVNANSSVTWNGLTLNKTAYTTNTITFNATELASESSISLVVTNIRNPATAIIANYNFTLTSPL